MPILADEIEQTLRSTIPITHLEIVDQSSGCGESYSIFVVSEAFEGKLTLARHRMVNELLKEQIAQLHAFSQKTLTPKQYAAQLEREGLTSPPSSG